MALRPHAVGAVPVDVGAALALDGDHVIENIGGRPLRFVVADAPGEAAPLDPRAGHLLQPGQRETVRTAAGTPVWAWSNHPTRLGVGPAWQVAAGLGGGPGGGGGGLSLLFAGRAVESRLTGGTHDVGRTVLNVTDAAGFAAERRALVRGEIYDVVAVDLDANTITLPDPGLTVRKLNNSRVVQAPLLGGGDVLQLPTAPLVELDIRCLFDLEQTNGSASVSNDAGGSTGAYYQAAAKAAWYQSLRGYAGLQDDEAATYAVGLIHSGITNLTVNSWSIELDPVTGRLSLAQVAANVSHVPRVVELLVAGGGGA